ncbi:hypothetical protein CAAN1_01S01882 [[Candida] anglica]|uniref:H-type lectin domain-containing protein n=1 Tax=[Candida] anglica TaxID=148631 RepID=A0ABP0EJ70_9ASCO
MLKDQVFLTLILAIQVLAFNFHNGSIQHVQSIPTTNNVKVQNSPETLYKFNSKSQLKTKPSLLKDLNSVFQFKEENSVISYDYKEKSWYEYEFDDRAVLEVFPDLVPVTMCFDSFNGTGGGSIQQSYSFSMTFTNKVYSAIKFNVSDLTISAALGFELASSVSFTGSYSCDISNGQYGQMFIEPFYVDVPEGTRQKVYYKDGIVKYDQVQEKTPSFKILSTSNPNHYCIVDTTPTTLQCDKTIGQWNPQQFI